MLRRFLTILILIFPFCLQGQKGLEVGGDIGISYYFGDLNTNYNLSQPGFALSLKARQNFNERLSVTGAFQMGQVKGSDSNSNNFFQRTRNLDFQSNFYDFSGVFEFNFFPYIHGSDDNFYTPYLFAGFSIMKFNPTTELDGVKYNLRDFGTEGQFFANEYYLISGSWVYGFGFKWDINKDWSFNAQIIGRKLFTDYIDDVSGSYPDFPSLENLRGPIAVELSDRSGMPDFVQPGMQRGNGKNNDVVYVLSIGIMRYFGQLQCPKISKPIY